MKNKRIVILIFRFLIVLCSISGMLILQIKHGVFDFEKYVFYTYQSNIIVTIVYSILVVKGIQNLREFPHESPTPRLSYALHEIVTFTITVTFIIFASFLSDYTSMVAEDLRLQVQIGSSLVHYVVPILVILDYFVHVRNPNSRYRVVFYNLIYPLVYFAFVMIRAELGGPLHNSFPEGEHISYYPYPFLDVDLLGWKQVILSAFVLMAGFVVLGVVIVLIDHKLFRHYPHHVVHWMREARKGKAMKGWDFSLIDDRANIDNLPWNYVEIVKSILKPTHSLLDIGTGNGLVLQSFVHTPTLITATESTIRSVGLIRKNLSPLGIKVVYTPEVNHLPFANDCFDVVTNRFSSLDLEECWRVLKQGGILITMQVGSNDSNNIAAILSDISKRLPSQFEKEMEHFDVDKWEIIDEQDVTTDIYFYEIGALVYFASALKDEFPHFSVQKKIPELEVLEKIIKHQGYISSIAHRHLLILKKRGK